jgi:hypothetical protein
MLALMTAGAVLVVGSAPASARDYAYCLQSRHVGIPGDCSYSTYAQCMASASGRNAECNINPRVAFSRRGYHRHYRHRHHRHHRYD